MGRVVRWLAGLGLLSLLAASSASAQPDRIAGPIDANRAVALKGHVRAAAQLQNDLGPAEPGLQLGYVSMLFKPSPNQQAALEKLLVDQQDPSSANYHRWLQPEQYADRFGLSPNDTAKIAGWLRSPTPLADATGSPSAAPPRASGARFASSFIATASRVGPTSAPRPSPRSPPLWPAS